MSRARVKLVEGLQFVGVADSGHAVVMDGTLSSGGRNTGSTPMELLLMGIGGCSGMDVASILRKKRQRLTGLEINVRGEKPDTYPKGFKDIELEFIVKGKEIEEEAVKRAIELSMEKYCSVKASLKAEVKWTYKIEEE